MSKTPEIPPQRQIEINRAEWIQALRENGHRQCIGWGRGGSHCAISLLIELAGIDSSIPFAWVEQATVWLGAPPQMALWPVAVDNDKGRTFGQIADAAEQGRYW